MIDPTMSPDSLLMIISDYLWNLNRVTSSLLLLLLSSDLTTRVGQLDTDLLGALDDLSSFLS